MEKEKKEKERKLAEENKQVTSFMTDPKEEEQESDVDIDDDEQFCSIINSFYTGPTKKEIDEEIQQALEGGMQLDSDNVFTLKQTQRMKCYNQ